MKLETENRAWILFDTKGGRKCLRAANVLQQEAPYYEELWKTTELPPGHALRLNMGAHLLRLGHECIDFDTIEIEQGFCSRIVVLIGQEATWCGPHATKQEAESEALDYYTDRCGHSQCSQYYIDTGNADCLSDSDRE